MSRLLFGINLFSRRSTTRLAKRRVVGARRLGVEALEDRFCLSAYHVGLLGTVGGAPVTPTGINSSGEVSGYYTNGGQTRGFLYSSGALTDLGTLGGGYTYAFGLNDSGQVVGESHLASGISHAFVYDAGVMTDLGTLGASGLNSAATAINNAGQIAGYSQISSGSVNRAFLYASGSMAPLGTLGGFGYSNAYGINEAGQVIGHSNGDGFLYSGGSLTNLGAVTTAASGINESGQIAGHTNEGVTHAQLYAGGVVTDLGTLGGAASIAHAINDAGKIVGYSTTIAGQTHAFLFSGGVMTDLNSLIDPGFEIQKAFGINNGGQIAAFGLDTTTGLPHGMLLSPVDDVTVTVGGGVFDYDGLPHAATASVTGLGGFTATPTVTYFVGTSPSGPGSLTPPIDAGIYTVVASYAGDVTHNPGSASTTLEIRPKQLSASGATQSSINISKAGTLTFVLSEVSGILAGDGTVFSLFDGATFHLQVNDTAYSVTSAATVLSNGSIAIAWHMNLELYEALHSALGSATPSDKTLVDFVVRGVSHDGNYELGEEILANIFERGTVVF
jgi:probable HAF family extracellular repeat protein